MVWFGLWMACASQETVPEPRLQPVPPVAGVVPLAEPSPAPAAPHVADADAGEASWRTYNCLACHGANGEGGVGPTLAGRVPTQPEMTAQVRAGAPPMPAYSASEVPDSAVADIRVWLLAQPVPGPPEPNPDTLATMDGVDVEVAVSGLDHPVAIVFCGDELYVSTNGGVYPRAGTSTGSVWRGRGDARRLYATDLERPVGLACVGDALWVSQRGRVTAHRDPDAHGRARDVRTVVEGLATEGLHQNNGLAVGPDGRVYMGMGSATNAQVEEPPNNSVLTVSEQGNIEVIATGFRNPFGLAFVGDVLYATDNGIDPPSVEAAAEELNQVVPGAFYGHPYWTGEVERQTGGPSATPPVMTFTPHASANGITAADSAQFPGHSGKLLVAEFGSYISRFYAAGRRVLLVDPVSGAQTVFASGFQGRPLDVAVGPEGAVYVTDFEQGVVWRFFASDRERTVFRPSFDCGRASTVVERAICNDPQLTVLDGELASVYTERRQALTGGDRTALRDAQRAWITERDACAADTWPVVCVKSSMLARIAELRGDAG